MASSTSDGAILAPFLRKTWDIVEDAETNHIISWSSNGRSFIVHKVEVFASQILPKFFKHSNWSSFVRQLNTYGFRKIDPDRWEFANESFVRGSRDLMNTITRRKPPAASGTVASRPQEYGAPTPVVMPPAQNTSPCYSLPAPYPLDVGSARPPPVALFQPTPAVNVPLFGGAQRHGMGTSSSAFTRPAAQAPCTNGTSPPASAAVELNPAASGAAAGSAARAAGATPLATSPGGNRLVQLVDDYLRPGQQILANIAVPQQNSSSDPVGLTTSSASGPSASTENDMDVEEASKTQKRTRADLYKQGSGSGTPEEGLAAAAMAASPGSAPGVQSARQLDSAGEETSSGADLGAGAPLASPSGQNCGGTTCPAAMLNKEGKRLPPGITRPVAHSMGTTTHNLLTEMAGQLGRLAMLATEVEDLKEQNMQLRRSMDRLAGQGKSSGASSSSTSNIENLLAEQKEKIWQYKLKSDDVELKIMAQQQAHQQQLQRSALLEAQLAQQQKLSFDAVELTRELEARNVALEARLQAQENVNQQTLRANYALEVRVAELEHQLKGGVSLPNQTVRHDAAGAEPLSGAHEELAKGIEDRVLNAVTGIFTAGGDALSARLELAMIQQQQQQGQQQDQEGQQHQEAQQQQQQERFRSGSMGNPFGAPAHSADGEQSHSACSDDTPLNNLPTFVATPGPSGAQHGTGSRKQELGSNPSSMDNGPATLHRLEISTTGSSNNTRSPSQEPTTALEGTAEAKPLTSAAVQAVAEQAGMETDT